MNKASPSRKQMITYLFNIKFAFFDFMLEKYDRMTGLQFEWFGLFDLQPTDSEKFTIKRHFWTYFILFKSFNMEVNFYAKSGQNHLW